MKLYACFKGAIGHERLIGIFLKIGIKMDFVVGKLFKEIGTWAERHDLQSARQPFLRCQVIDWDRWSDPKGDAFRARYGTNLTDPAVEPRKTRWEIEVAIKLADDQD